MNSPKTRSAKLYSALINLLPTRFHIRFGSTMESDFNQMLADAPTSVSRIKAWRTVLVDLAGTLIREWSKEIMVTAIEPNRLTSHLGAVGRDIRHAVRSLRRSPGYTVAALATLTLGIGANTAVFSLANWALLKPTAGVTKESELTTVRFYHSENKFFIPSSHAALLAFQEGSTDLAKGITAYHNLHSNVSTGVDVGAEQLDGQMVTRNFFSLLGIQMQWGAGFALTAPPEGEAVAVVSHRFWMGRLAGDQSAIGTDLLVNGRPTTIVGVAPEGFRGPESPGSADIWFPVDMVSLIAPVYRNMLTSTGITPWFSLIARLSDGATMESLQANLQSIYEGSQESIGGTTGFVPQLRPGLGTMLTVEQHTAKMMWLLMASVGLVLLLACANSANLMLARATGRTREISVRAALGASRLRLIRMMLVESLMISTAGAVAAIILATWLVGFFEGFKLVSWLPGVERVPLDTRVLSFTVAVASFAGVGFGLMPSIASSNLDIAVSLRSGSSGNTGHSAIRGALVTFQVALSLVLVVGAFMMARTIGNLRAVDVGADLKGSVSFALDANLQGYDETEARALFSEVKTRLEATPGVTNVSRIAFPPFGRMQSGVRVRLPEDAPDATGIRADHNLVGGGFFTTIGAKLLDGRDFRPSDMPAEGVEGGLIPVIVNRSFVNQHLSERAAIGAHLIPKYYENQTYEIIGVIGDALLKKLSEDITPALYTPVGTGYFPMRVTFVVAGTIGAEQTMASIRTVVRDIDPMLPPADLRILADAAEDTISGRILVARLSMVLSVLALVIAASGLYGVVSYSVVERTKEFGIRTALGAEATSLVREVLYRALKPGAIGLVLGVIGATQFSRLIESQLWGVEPLSPGNYVLGTSVLFVSMIFAALIPAIKATRVDPVKALKTD